MNPPPEPVDPMAVESADRLQNRLRSLGERCADLEERLAESEAARSKIEGKLARLQAEFDRMESQLLTILSGRAFRYSRGARRLWSRIKGS